MASCGNFFTDHLSYFAFSWSKLRPWIPMCRLLSDLLSVNSHRGVGAVLAPRQSPQSPADVACLALPDVGVEDVLELQFQQLTVAQFTVATMEHAIPLLKTGRILNFV